MVKKTINELFAAYLNDRELGLEPLLEEIRKTAILKFRDEDKAQDFVIEMWKLLPTLIIEVKGKKGGGFFTFLKQRLRWRNINNKTRIQKRQKEAQLPELTDEDGELKSTQDTIDLLQYKGVSWQELGRKRGIEDYGYQEIDDEFLQDVSNMLLTGKTQDQIAAALGTSREVLHRKILRHLEKLAKKD
jgi:hypothetical protein